MSSNPLATFCIGDIEISSQKEMTGTLMITWLAAGFSIVLERSPDLQADMPRLEMVGSKREYGVKDLGHAIPFTLLPGQVILIRVVDDFWGHTYVTRLLTYDLEGSTYALAPYPRNVDIPGYTITRVSPQFQVGARLTVTNLICRATIIDAVGTGAQIVKIDPRSHVAIRLDEHIEVLNEWDNEITVALDSARSNGRSLEEEMLTEFAYANSR